jgi:DNA-binding GntR family transcriptional regulator
MCAAIRSIDRSSDEADIPLPMTRAAYDTIRRLILDNAWTAGFQATELEVAEKLGMSRTPVREALMRLQQEGLVKVIPRHGMRVLPVSPEDMTEIYQILTSLECTAAELVAARHANGELLPGELAALEEASLEMDISLQQDDLDGWAMADERFHANLLDLCGNRMLKAAVLNFWDRAHRARMVTLRLRPKPVHSTREHAELVDAIRRGDGAGAREMQRLHRERAGRELLDVLRRAGLTLL